MRFTRGGEVLDGARPAMIRAAVLLATFASILLLASPAWAQTPPTEADLSITKSGPAQVEPGQNFNYVLTVSNAAGAAAATNVTVTDDLPAGVTLVEADPAICTPATGPGTIECTVGPLAAGASRTITLTVRSNTPGEITNQASARADNDPDSPVNSNRVTTRVIPNLEIRKIDEPEPVRVGDLILYTLRVQNRGETTLAGTFGGVIGVTDDLPLDQVDFVSVDSNDFDCEYTAGAVQCNLRSFADLNPGEIVKVEVAVKAKTAGTIRNRADVFATGVRGPVDTDFEETVVRSNAAEDDDDGGDGDDNGDGGDNGDGNGDGNTASDEDDVIKSTVPDKTLADTGGAPGVAVTAGLLLVAAGSLLRASLRRER